MKRKYSWEDALNWKILYERLGSFKGVELFIKKKKNIDSNGPHEDTIRDYVYKYITQVLKLNYEAWINHYNQNRRDKKYSIKDISYWKELYQKFGSLRKVRKYLIEHTNGNSPDAITIRKGLKKLLGNNYKKWLLDYAKKSLNNDEIEAFKELFEQEGTYNALRDITGHDTKTIRKHLKRNIKDYDEWFEKHSKYHLRKCSENEILEYISLFEELGSFASVSYEIKSTYNKTIAPSVIRKIIKRFFIENCKDYQDWFNEFSLSDNLVMIGKCEHGILEYYFMLNFKEKNFLAFYEICPNFILSTLFRVDNSLIITRELINFINLNISEKIKIINIDYVLSPNPRLLYTKFRKGYHGENMLLIIIPLFSKLTRLEIPLDINYKNNIKILTPDDFFRIMNFSRNLMDRANYAISLAKKAPYSPSAFSELSDLAKDTNLNLINSYGKRSIQQKTFKAEFIKRS